MSRKEKRVEENRRDNTISEEVQGKNKVEKVRKYLHIQGKYIQSYLSAYATKYWAVKFKKLLLEHYTRTNREEEWLRSIRLPLQGVK